MSYETTPSLQERYINYSRRAIAYMRGRPIYLLTTRHRLIYARAPIMDIKPYFVVVLLNTTVEYFESLKR
jgi:hypothetical protein